MDEITQAAPLMMPYEIGALVIGALTVAVLSWTLLWVRRYTQETRELRTASDRALAFEKNRHQELTEIHLRALDPVLNEIFTVNRHPDGRAMLSCQIVNDVKVYSPRATLENKDLQADASIVNNGNVTLLRLILSDPHEGFDRDVTFALHFTNQTGVARTRRYRFRKRSVHFLE